MLNKLFGPQFGPYLEASPLTLVDVGARGGLPREWKPAANYLHVVGFEPDRPAFNALEDSVDRYRKTNLNVGLSDERGTRAFYVTRIKPLSSILRPNRDLLDRFPNASRFDVVDTVQIRVDTLDHQLREHGIDDVDFVKVDTQGSELPILRGASETLDEKVFGLAVETSFVERYTGQAVFAEIDGFLRQFGFEVFDLRPFYWKAAAPRNSSQRKGRIVYADALYLRDVERFGELIERIPDRSRRKSKLLRAVAVCVLYGYFDYASVVLASTSRHFGRDEQELLAQRIDEMQRAGKLKRLSDFAYLTARNLLASHRGWATFSGTDLGSRGRHGLFDYTP